MLLTICKKSKNEEKLCIQTLKKILIVKTFGVTFYNDCLVYEPAVEDLVKFREFKEFRKGGLLKNCNPDILQYQFIKSHFLNGQQGKITHFHRQNSRPHTPKILKER